MFLYKGTYGDNRPPQKHLSFGFWGLFTNDDNNQSDPQGTCDKKACPHLMHVCFVVVVDD
jgi:hypothetical protein